MKTTAKKPDETNLQGAHWWSATQVVDAKGHAVVPARYRATIERDGQARETVAIVFGGSHDEAEARARLFVCALDLLEAVKAQHQAIDRLFALLIEKVPGFFPTQSGQPWAACLLGNAAIEKTEGR